MKISEISRTAQTLIDEHGADAAGAAGDWTKEGLVRALARAGLSVEDDYELEILLALVSRQFKFEGPLGDAIGDYLEAAGFDNLVHAANRQSCSVEQLINRIAKDAGLISKRH